MAILDQSEGKKKPEDQLHKPSKTEEKKILVQILDKVMKYLFGSSSRE